MASVTLALPLFSLSELQVYNGVLGNHFKILIEIVVKQYQAFNTLQAETVVDITLQACSRLDLVALGVLVFF